MASDSLLPLIFLCCFLIPLSVACPESFKCGDLGEVHFPFTKEECPPSGLLPVRGCDDPNASKEVHLGGQWVEMKSIHPQYGNMFKIVDHKFQDLLSSRNCSALENITISLRSPFASFHIVNKINLFKCKNHPKIAGPEPEHYFGHPGCPDDYETYFYPRSLEYMNNELPSSTFQGCSVVQLPFKPPPPSQTSLPSDPFELLTAEIILEVELSRSCFECHHLGEWQCLLDEECSGDGKPFDLCTLDLTT